MPILMKYIRMANIRILSHILDVLMDCRDYLYI